MFSDIVCECLVKRKLNVVQIAKIAGVLTAGIGLSIALLAIGAIADFTGMLPSMLFLCAIAVTVYLVRFLMMVEFEYTFVNGEMTIDRILARSSRKNMAEINVKTVEKMGKYDPAIVNTLKASAVKDYSVGKDDPNTMFLYCKDEKTEGNTVILFTPNQKLLDAMKPYVSATVYREAFREKKANQ